MKSAYEIAMEKFGGAAPKISDAKKAELAELDSLYQSKIAERRTLIEPQIRLAQMARDTDTADALKAQLANNVAVLTEEMEEKKEKARNRAE